MSQTPNIFIAEIQDSYAKENFKTLKNLLPILYYFANFKAFEVTFASAETEKQFSHGLGFLPKDIIITSKTNGITVSFNQDKSTKDLLFITVDGPCNLRFLAGSFYTGG